MKTTENKGFGIIGVRVELSFIELLLIREQLAILAESNLLDMNRTRNPGPDRVALLNVVRFCEKMIYSNLGEEMEKVGRELFSTPEPDAERPLASEGDPGDQFDWNNPENQAPANANH